MPVTLDGKLVVAISSRALFDFEEENRIFEQGDDKAYMRLQLERLDTPAAHGVAFSLVHKLLAFNDAHAQRVEVRRRTALARCAAFRQTLRDECSVLGVLRAALQALPWATVSALVVSDAMVRASHRTDVMRQRAMAHGHDEDWHRWRRSMRRLSQQHRAVVAAGLVVPQSELDKHLTVQLGVMQDLSLLIAHCQGTSPFSKATRRELREFAERSLARQRKRIRSVVPGD